jgi:enoyl reductase-like protein
MAAAGTGYDGELAGGDQVVENLLDSAPAEPNQLLERGLVGDPHAFGVGVVGDGE